MNTQKYLFIDRDGTLIEEPADMQIDSLEKLQLMPHVIPALLRLQKAGFILVMVSNQDGLGSETFPREDFNKPHDYLVQLFQSQGVQFAATHICPHRAEDHCECRKPKIGLLRDYLVKQMINHAESYVIGDRETDMALAAKLAICGIRISASNHWQCIADRILLKTRVATFSRSTKETKIVVKVDLDQEKAIDVKTGIGFFDHMLEQLAKHGGFGLSLKVSGDLHIDDHHTVEDTALCLGEVLRKALGDKWGIQRYGFLLPMDESLARVALDLSGRPYCVYKGVIPRESVGGLATELIPHFFRSFADGLKAALHIEVQGDNAHHMIEALFKSVGRAIRQAILKVDQQLPSTKGVL